MSKTISGIKFLEWVVPKNIPFGLSYYIKKGVDLPRFNTQQEQDVMNSLLQFLFPFLFWLPGVNKESLKADLLAGLTGAVSVLPQGVAFATIAERMMKNMELEKKKADAEAYHDDDKAEEAKQRGNEHFRNKEWWVDDFVPRFFWKQSFGISLSLFNTFAIA